MRSGTTWSQQAKLTAGDGAPGDRFGNSAAISGDTIVVGAYREDEKGSDAGAVYVFVRSGTTWSQKAKRTASDGATDDLFGDSVAISGDIIVVGATYDDDMGDGSGSAYVFELSGGVWLQMAKLTASDGAAGDNFGNSVAISGNTAMVGAYVEDEKGSDAGAAYVFRPSAGVWSQEAKLTAGDGDSLDRFGNSVAISGNTAVVGAVYDEDKGAYAGSAYVFVRISLGVWSQTKLMADDGAASDYFGESVAISGDTIVVGAFGDDDKGDFSGSAYVYRPMLSINDVSLAEGNSGTTNAVFTVTLSRPSGETVAVNYQTADGTASAGTDYTATSGTLTFTAGQTSKTITVAVLGDTLDEPDETFYVNLSTPSNATIVDGRGVGTIGDDDPTPTLSISDVSVIEGNSGTPNAVFTVTLSAPSGTTVRVDYSTADGTALAGTDYTATSGGGLWLGLTFSPGQTTRTIAVPVLGDTLDEPDETFFVNLSNANHATIADSQGVGTITDDDPPPALSINNVSVVEGNSGTTDVVFTVTLSDLSSKTVTVDYTTVNETATAGTDYQATTGTLTFTPGQTTNTITVPVLGDTLDEPTETFYVYLFPNPVNATIADSHGVGVINDDDSPPRLNINDVTVVEGNSGTIDAEFTVTLSDPSGQTVTVDYATADGTATAGSDYQAISGTLTFAPGETTKTIAVPVLGDTIEEPNENFTVNLSNPTNATILINRGRGYITNDDLLVLNINDVTVVEGDSGTSNAEFTVTLSDTSSQTVTVGYATASGTATPNTDFGATKGTLTFAPGETTKTITVHVIGDTLDEPDETFYVNLSNPTNAAIADSQGVGTITDDDQGNQPPVLGAIGNKTLNEGTLLSFTATATDPDLPPNTLTFSLTGTVPAGTAINPATGAFTWTPTEAQGPGSYTFDVVVSDGSLTDSETITVTVNEMQSVLTTIQLKDSAGNPLSGGVVQYYSGGWQVFGTTDATGNVTKELVPGTYSFSMTYAFGRQEKSQNVASNPIAVFQTTKVTVQLQDSTGAPLDTGTVQYYSGGWRDIGTTSSGNVTKELLPLTYSFSMTYGFGRQEKSQNVTSNPVVVFQTGKIHSDSGSCTKYYAGGWRTFVQDMQLLPLTYTFSFNDGTPDKSYTITAGADNHIH